MMAGAKGCVSSEGSRVCTHDLFLEPGRYFASVTAYGASGAAISVEQSIPLKIRASRTTLVNLALNGIPNSISVVGGVPAIAGSSRGGLTLYGTTPQPAVVIAYDAYGNAIVGPGSPSYSLSLVSGSGWNVQATPNPLSPNVFTITPPGTTGSGAVVSVAAHAPAQVCSQAGAICTGSFSITNHIDTVFVLEEQPVYAFFGPPILVRYTINSFNPSPVTLTTNLTKPTSLAMDQQNNLFVADAGANDILVLAPPYTAPPATTISTTSPQQAVVYGEELFVANGTSGVSIFNPPYASPLRTYTTEANASNAVAVDSSGNLFVCEADSVREYTPPYGASPAATIANGTGAPTALAFDASGDLFVSSDVNNTVTEFMPPFSNASTPVATLRIVGPGPMAFDSEGNLFVVYNGPRVAFAAQYAPPFTNASLPANRIGGELFEGVIGVALDGGDNLFVLNYGLGGASLQAFSPPAWNLITNPSLFKPNAMLVR
ncbi:MAG: hypothetical protein JOY98_06805 [Candidatus Eremiobacteraeota bacterium]|nr:hypothetical protein [Candidatus Eremiobacteraeota bacterium]